MIEHCRKNVGHLTVNGLVIRNTLCMLKIFTEDFLVTGDCFCFYDAILVECVCTLCVTMFSCALCISLLIQRHHVYSIVFVCAVRLCTWMEPW